MRTVHAPGSPNWFELATTDQAGAKAFYAALFGWTAEDDATADGGVYTVFMLGDREVAAACTMATQPREQGASPGWGVYFKTENVDAAAAKVAAGGGEVLAPPFEVENFLRMAVCADPGGATFSLYQPKAHDGVAAFRENNAVCWVELATWDVPAAEAFYADMFGWTMQTHVQSPTLYRMFGGPDRTFGGLLQMTTEWGDMLSQWSIYIQVEDVDATVGKALSLGAVSCFPAFDAPGVGRIARIDDPAGAGFYVIRFLPSIDV